MCESDWRDPEREMLARESSSKGLGSVAWQKPLPGFMLLCDGYIHKGHKIAGPALVSGFSLHLLYKLAS